MVIQMIWIAVIYGLAIALVHGVYALTRLANRNNIQGVDNQFTLITCNHERQVEWYVRALWLYSWIRGKELRMLVVDEVSSDDTVRMIHKLIDSLGLHVCVRVCLGVDADELRNSIEQEGFEGSTVIDLRLPHEASRIPYVQG
ncbi:hypothetical protein [Paenibacillus sp. CMAA1364]